MWPFRKKADRISDSMFAFFWGMTREAAQAKIRRPEPSDAECFEMRCKAIKALADFKMDGLKSYTDAKRRRREEGKMKLEAGKYYETHSGIHECKRHEHPQVHGVFEVGGGFYYEDGRPLAPQVIAPILREAPPPLKLVVGALYETTAGAQRCTERCYKDCFRLAGFVYTEEGTAFLQGAPKILYKIRVNEPVSGGGAGQQLLDLCEKRSREICDTALAGRFDGGINTPMPVTYKPHTDCNKREPIAPEGFELLPPHTANDISDLLVERDGFWVKCSMPIDVNKAIIRPIAKPFKVEGKGWYQLELGSWVKITERGWDTNWNDDGSSKLPHIISNIVCRATPTQAKILDAL